MSNHNVYKIALMLALYLITSPIISRILQGTNEMSFLFPCSHGSIIQKLLFRQNSRHNNCITMTLLTIPIGNPYFKICLGSLFPRSTFFLSEIPFLSLIYCYFTSIYHDSLRYISIVFQTLSRDQFQNFLLRS
mgnify:CR=1 FL=1